MLASLGRVFLVSTLVFVAGTEAANARFGFRIGGVRGLSLHLPGRLGLRLPRIYGRRGLGRTLGIVGAVTVGSVILQRLSVRDRNEVARRARLVVSGNPEDRVVNSYSSPDGSHLVTMTAEPALKAAAFKGDPALQKMSDAEEPLEKAANMQGMSTTDGRANTSKKDASDKQLIKLSDLPEDASCRRVMTEYESKSGRARTTAEAKESNTAIMCQTAGGEWKPAGA